MHIDQSICTNRGHASDLGCVATAETFMHIQLNAATFALSQPHHDAARRRFRALHIERGSAFSTLISRLPNGRLDGPYMVVHTDEDAYQMQYYLSGTSHGTSSLHERGVARVRAGYVGAKLQGPYMTWSRKGVLTSHAIYDGGKYVHRFL